MVIACPLEEVLITSALKKRTTRAPDLTAENAVFHRLSRGLLRPPLVQLQDLLDAALSLCSAGSAGISLIKEDSEAARFEWVVLAGKYAAHVGGTTPRRHSPCGVTLERGEPQLFEHPARHFEYFAGISPSIVEGLVVPIEGPGSPSGTIWIVSHSRKTEFDMEDVRLMTSLAGFAAFACSPLSDEGRRAHAT